MLEWKDATSYRQGEVRGNVPPRSWELIIDGMRIVIHRHKDYENTWLLSCYKLDIEQMDLKTNDFKEAEQAAVKILVDKINSFVEIRDKLLQHNE